MKVNIFSCLLIISVLIFGVQSAKFDGTNGCGEGNYYNSGDTYFEQYSVDNEVNLVGQPRQRTFSRYYQL